MAGCTMFKFDSPWHPWTCGTAQVSGKRLILSSFNNNNNNNNLYSAPFYILYTSQDHGALKQRTLAIYVTLTDIAHHS